MTSNPPNRIEGDVHGDVVGGDKTVTQTAGGDIVGGDKITLSGTGHIFAGSGSVLVVQPQLSPASARDRANLLLLLNKVKTFWIAGVLERSVHTAFLLELGRELHTDAIDHPWASVLELPDAATRPLPANVSDIQVFDEAGRALLILGAPGAGKTTTLLEIARDLLARAEVDDTQPVPVVFSLSSWDEHRASLSAWLVAELASRYQVPPSLSRAFLAEHWLLPFLDGLDEVAPASQTACIRAVNKFARGEGLAGLVICCRTEEYSRLPVRLQLNAAISISPLSPAQIEAYLAAGGERLAALRTIMLSDDVLSVLAQTPLFLSIMCLAYRDVELAALSDSALNTVEARRRHVLDHYVARMLKRKGQNPGRASDADLLRWLGWLARRLNANSQTVFLGDRLQPSWLDNDRGRWAYALLSRVGLWLSFGLGMAFTTAASAVIAANLPSATASGATIAPLSGVGGLVLLNDIAGTASLFTVIGAIAGLICGARFALSVHRAALPAPPPLPRWRAVRNVLAGTVLPASPVIVLDFWNSLSAPSAVLWEILVGGIIIWASILFVASIALRAFEAGESLARDIPIVDTLDWSWYQSLKGALFGFLGCVLAASICVVINAPGLPWLNTVISALTWSVPFGLLGALVAGTIAGVRGRSSVGNARPGHWALRHARNALAAGLLIGGVIGLAVGLVALGGLYLWLIEGVSVSQNTYRVVFVLSMAFGLVAGLPTGTTAALFYGGASVIQRLALRLVLFAQRRAPLRMTPLASQAEDLVFLRQVGGGCIFIHRLVQDYFASLPTR